MRIGSFLLALLALALCIALVSAQPNVASSELIARDMIADNKIMVFSKSYCPFCRRAKDTLSKMNIDFGLTEMDSRSDGLSLQQALQRISGQWTVPNIFISGRHIGGSDRLHQMLETGELYQLLESAGIKFDKLPDEPKPVEIIPPPPAPVQQELEEAEPQQESVPESIPVSASAETVSQVAEPIPASTTTQSDEAPKTESAKPKPRSRLTTARKAEL